MDLEGPLELASVERNTIKINWKNSNYLFGTGDGLPIFVIAVVGRCQTGKSFLMNYLLKSAKERGKLTSLDTNEDRLTGFLWRKSAKPVTRGILAWPISYQSNTAKNWKIVLLDVQGISHSGVDQKIDILLLAMVFRLSSLVLFNISGQITSDDLRIIKQSADFVGLSEEIKSPIHLYFVLRDFIAPSWPYNLGTKGGDLHLQDTFLLVDGDSDSTKMLKLVKNVFEKVKGIVFPTPGFICSFSKQYNGCLKELTRDFKNILRVLISKVFNYLDSLDGQERRFHGLAKIMEKFSKDLSDSSFPQPQDAYKLVTEATVVRIAEKAFEGYRINMEKEFGVTAPNEPSKVFIKKHEELRMKALEEFENAKKLGTTDFINKQNKILDKRISEASQLYDGINELKTMRLFCLNFFWKLFPHLFGSIIILMSYFLLHDQAEVILPPYVGYLLGVLGFMFLIIGCKRLCGSKANWPFDETRSFLESSSSNLWNGLKFCSSVVSWPYRMFCRRKSRSLLPKDVFET